MNAFLVHFRMKFRSLFSDFSYRLLLLWLYFIITISFGGISKSFGSSEGDLYSFLILVTLAYVMRYVVAGRSAKGNRIQMELYSHPYLPISMRTLNLAESFISLFAILFLRLIELLLYFILEQALPERFFEKTLIGVLITFPLLLAMPPVARGDQFSIQIRFLVMPALGILALKLGLLATSISCLVTCLVLSAVSLVMGNLKISITGHLADKPLRDPGLHYRFARQPELQLRRDQWLRPFRQLCPIVAIFAVLYIGGLVMSSLGFLQNDYLAAVIVGGFFLLFVICQSYPMGIPFGSTGSKGIGDFITACSHLPVRRESVVRGIYLHALIAGFLSCLAAVGTLLLAGCSEYIPLFLPLAASIFCLAGCIISNAVGDNVRSLISITAVMVLIFSSFSLDIFMKYFPSFINAGTLVVITLVGALPPIIHLRSPSRLGKSGTG